MTERSCVCDVCKKAKEMLDKNHSHYICIPAMKLLDPSYEYKGELDA